MPIGTMSMTKIGVIPTQRATESSQSLVGGDSGPVGPDLSTFPEKPEIRIPAEMLIFRYKCL